MGFRTLHPAVTPISENPFPQYVDRESEIPLGLTQATIALTRGNVIRRHYNLLFRHSGKFAAHTEVLHRGRPGLYIRNGRSKYIMCKTSVWYGKVTKFYPSPPSASLSSLLIIFWMLMIDVLRGKYLHRTCKLIHYWEKCSIASLLR